MSEFRLPFVRLVHENLSIVLCYAYSAKPLWGEILARMAGRERFAVDLYGIADQRAQKALMELALFLRTLDDDQEITPYLIDTDSNISCGELLMKNGPPKPLPMREVSNKIIHARSLDWGIVLRDDGDKVREDTVPTVTCVGRDDEKWSHAVIDLMALAFVCSQFKERD